MSTAYIVGYNDGLSGIRYSNPFTIMNIHWYEYHDGYYVGYNNRLFLKRSYLNVQ